MRKNESPKEENGYWDLYIYHKITYWKKYQKGLIDFLNKEKLSPLNMQKIMDEIKEIVRLIRYLDEIEKGTKKESRMEDYVVQKYF